MQDSLNSAVNNYSAVMLRYNSLTSDVTLDLALALDDAAERMAYALVRSGYMTGNEEHTFVTDRIADAHRCSDRVRRLLKA